MDVMGSKMPTMLSKLPNVRSFVTHGHLLGFSPTDLPGLEELMILGTRAIELPRGAWPKLQSVEARDAKVSIADASELPALSTLSIGTKGTPKVFTEMAKLRKLRKLHFGPVKDDATLSCFADMPLTDLAFNRGSIASLKGVTRFAKLTQFGAMNCHAFADLAPLAELPLLEEVWLTPAPGSRSPTRSSP